MEDEINHSHLELIKNKIYSPKNLENEIYISRKRKNIEKFYYKRAEDLFNNLNYKEVYICGLGACVNHAVKIALITVDCIPGTKIENIETKTITHKDEFRDKLTGLTATINENRMSNFIKIKVIKEKNI